MSVGEADLKKVLAMSNILEKAKPTHKKGGDSSLSGVMRDFKGELSQQFDRLPSPLDLKDPSAQVRASMDSARGRFTQRPQLRIGSPPVTGGARSTILDKQVSSSPTETSPPPLQRSSTPVEEAIVPPRSSSLNTPVTNTSENGVTTRTGSIKYGPRDPRSNSVNSFGPNAASTSGRDVMRQRGHHRHTASSSEPSLIPIRDDDRNKQKTVRLVPSTTSMGWPEANSPALSLYLSSQTDLTGGEDGPYSKAASSAPSREDSNAPDVQNRGREFAKKCWIEDEEFLAREKIAEWLGGQYVIFTSIVFISFIRQCSLPFSQRYCQ